MTIRYVKALLIALSLCPYTDTFSMERVSKTPIGKESQESDHAQKNVLRLQSSDGNILMLPMNHAALSPIIMHAMEQQLPGTIIMLPLEENTLRQVIFFFKRLAELPQEELAAFKAYPAEQETIIALNNPLINALYSLGIPLVADLSSKDNQQVSLPFHVACQFELIKTLAKSLGISHPISLPDIKGSTLILITKLQLQLDELIKKCSPEDAIPRIFQPYVTDMIYELSLQGTETFLHWKWKPNGYYEMPPPPSNPVKDRYV